VVVEKNWTLVGLTVETSGGRLVAGSEPPVLQPSRLWETSKYRASEALLSGLKVISIQLKPLHRRTRHHR
jgi:hypothetical protein